MNINGLHIRIETEGMYIFNSHTGLIYYVVESEKKKIIIWLENNSFSAIENSYLQTIGAGWLIPINECNLSHSQILPNLESWTNQIPDFPLVINWFLTGSCMLDCIYCYAEDLMRKNVANPSLNEIKKIGKNIIEMKPLVVVLTGGDPIASPYLKNAIEILSGHAGILLDTSGYILKDETANFCKDYNVGIRISLDSSDPLINNAQRPLWNKSHQRSRTSIENETNSIRMCLSKKIPLTIQTVLTDLNIESILKLGDFLFSLGVKVWRIQKLQEPSTQIKKIAYSKLTINNINYINAINSIKERNANKWMNSISIKFTENNINNRNSVILVAPNGMFFTEQLNNKGKVLIDKLNPYTPSQKSVLKFINHSGHLLRYLNIEI